MTGLVGSPVCSFHSSSSLVRLNLFFSWASFSTYSWRLAFSSDSCLRGDRTSPASAAGPAGLSSRRRATGPRAKGGGGRPAGVRDEAGRRRIRPRLSRGHRLSPQHVRSQGPLPTPRPRSPLCPAGEVLTAQCPQQATAATSHVRDCCHPLLNRVGQPAAQRSEGNGTPGQTQSPRAHDRAALRWHVPHKPRRPGPPTW